MDVFKVTKSSDYTVLDNGFLKRDDMSLKAIGLLSKILSLPPDWNFSVKGIAVRCKESEKAIRATLKELQSLGYHHYSKISKNGTFVYQYDFYENPNLNPHYQNAGVQNAHVQKVDVPNVDVPKVDIQKGNDNKILKELNTQQIKYSSINTLPDFSNSNNFLTHNTNSLNQESSSKSQSLEAKPKEVGRFDGEQIETKPVKSNYPCEVFNRLWTGYLSFAGSKIGNKGDGYKAWQKVKNKASPQEFEKAIAAYSLTESVKGNRKGEKFIMQFSTFLNSGRWETELDMADKTLETHREKPFSAMDELREQIKQEKELQKQGVIK